MKKIIVCMLTILLASDGQAQRIRKKTPDSSPQISSSAQLVLRQPDLTVSCSDISAVTESIGVGGFGKRKYYTYINVTVTISNSGQMGSQSVTLRGYAVPNPLNRTSIAPPPAFYYDSKISIGDWRSCREEEAGTIAPGAVLTRTFRFETEPRLLGSGRTFFFCVLADYYKTTNESNENNNLSVPIVVTNPNF